MKTKIVAVLILLAILPCSGVFARGGIVFPTSPAADALTGTFITSYPPDESKQLTLWIWRESNFVWMKMTPVKGTPSFYSSNFTLIQDSMEYDISLVDSNGSSAFNPSSATIFQVRPYSSNVIPDFVRAFVLKYDYNYKYTPHEFNIPASSGGGCTQTELQAKYDAGFAAGKATCTGGSCTQTELQAKYDEGFTAGKATCTGCTQTELENKYNAGHDVGYTEGFAAGKTTCTGCTQTELETKYQTGYTAGHDSGYKAGTATCTGCTSAEITASYQSGYDKGKVEGKTLCAGSMYTQSDVDALVKAMIAWDINGDGKLDMSDIIYGLQTMSGIKH